MCSSRLVAAIISMGLMATAGAVWSQNYPEKPLRIVGSLPGGGSDLIMRLLAPSLRNSLGQPIVIDNRPSALLPEIGLKAQPDGYTMIVIGSSFLVGHLLRSTPWDPIRGFAPVSWVDAGPNVLLVHPSVPVQSVAELIAFAKAKPGQLNYASSAAGATSHLAGELFKSMAGINMVWVPFKSLGQGFIALQAGETQVIFKDAAGVAQQVKAGRVRALAVTSPEPSPLFPGLPTVSQSGLPGYETLVGDGIVVPAKTPAAIIKRLNQDIVRTLKQPDVREALFNTGAIAIGSSPEEFGKFMKSEVAKWSKVIKDAGIKAD